MIFQHHFKQIRKRDGRLVPFDGSRITSAVYKAMQASGEGNLEQDPVRVSDKVVRELVKRFPKEHIPQVEEIQDVVEETLILMDFPKTAKAYILYRHQRSLVREKTKEIPDNIKQLVAESKKYFRNELSEFIYYRTYSRWIEREGRRETWIETVARYVDFMRQNLGKNLSDGEYEEISQAILKQEVMPSMRLMWSAGKAASATNVAAYNCSFIAPKELKDFSEIMYLLMCGTGVGFSVESQTAQQLPIIKRQTGKALPIYVIEDSKEGWGNALYAGMKTWYEGKDIKFDYSSLRPAGARLHTMGGRSSGPDPLRFLLDFTRERILARQGRRLTNLDIHDIICKIGELVVMGGVRRCLPRGTLIHTKQGLKLIQNIVSGEEVLTAKGVFRRVLSTRYTGKRKLFNIHTQLGIFRSTGEHRWATLADLDGNIKWVPAKDLTTEDTLLHIPDLLPGRNTVLPTFVYQKPKYSTTTRDIKIPKLDPDTAWLIGYLHGDGYVYRKDSTYGEVMFACSPDMPNTAKRIKIILERFGVKARIVRYKHDKSIRVRTKSNQLANYLYQFKPPKKSIVIPDFILEGQPEIRAAYVAGVFDSDGSIKSKNEKKVRPIIASSIYPDWMRQLRALLASLGVSSSVKENRPARGKWQALYQIVTVSINALNIFGEWMEKCDSEKWHNDARFLERKKEQCSFVIPGQLLAQSPQRFLFDRAYYSPSSAVSLSLSKFEREAGQLVLTYPMNFATTPSSSNPLHGACVPVKVLRVTPAHADFTYDIQVEGDERFVAEGMLVHNSALISLSDLDDPEMRDAKKGQFYMIQPQRSMANNSAVYNTKPSAQEFMEEWLALAKSGSGERGIFNRGGLKYQLPERRWKTFEKYWQTSGTNPCGEIILRSKQFCNLSEVICRFEDTEESLLRKIRIATILGTYQSTLTSFPYISKEWKENCEEERLLGVSLTGQWDSSAARNADTLYKLRARAIEVNIEYAKRFGINPSTCITCVKPSGTVSQLVDAASGMHPRHAPYYMRRVRISATDPLFNMLRDQKFPYHPEVGQLEQSATTYVLEFPVKSPPGSAFRNDLKAIDQLNHWKIVKQNYTEHNPSVTVSISEDEWVGVANWLYDKWDILGGLSFLPRFEHIYKLSPYEDITEERYEELVSKFPKIDFSRIVAYEREDETSGAKELACVSGLCEVDLENGGTPHEHLKAATSPVES